MAVQTEYEVRQAGDRISIAFGQRIDHPSLQQVQQLLEKALSRADRERTELVFDLRPCASFDLDTRQPLLALHTYAAQRVHRSAYLAERPNMRGLATWLLHCTADQNGCVAMNEKQLDAWFASTMGRVATFRQRAEEAVSKLDVVSRKAGR